MALVEEIGLTEELNSIYSVTINSTLANSTTNVVECGVHAREWISHAFCLFLIHEILWGFYQVSSTLVIPESLCFLQHLQVNQTWIILPNMNPDGYRYTYDQERLWRKNRADTNQTCLGVDLNRNHDYNWHKAKERMKIFLLIS